MKNPQKAILAAIATVVIALGAFVTLRDNGTSTETDATQTVCQLTQPPAGGAVAPTTTATPSGGVSSTSSQPGTTKP